MASLRTIPTTALAVIAPHSDRALWPAPEAANAGLACTYAEATVYLFQAGNRNQVERWHVRCMTPAAVREAWRVFLTPPLSARNLPVYSLAEMDAAVEGDRPLAKEIGRAGGDRVFAALSPGAHVDRGAMLVAVLPIVKRYASEIGPRHVVFADNPPAHLGSALFLHHILMLRSREAGGSDERRTWRRRAAELWLRRIRAPRALTLETALLNADRGDSESVRLPALPDLDAGAIRSVVESLSHRKKDYPELPIDAALRSMGVISRP